MTDAYKNVNRVWLIRTFEGSHRYKFWAIVAKDSEEALGMVTKSSQQSRVEDVCWADEQQYASCEIDILNEVRKLTSSAEDTKQ